MSNFVLLLVNVEWVFMCKDKACGITIIPLYFLLTWKATVKYCRFEVRRDLRESDNQINVTQNIALSIENAEKMV